MHKSTPPENVAIKDLCEEVADNIIDKSPPTIKSKKARIQYGNKAMKKVITIMKPIMEKNWKVVAKSFVTQEIPQR